MGFPGAGGKRGEKEALLRRAGCSGGGSPRVGTWPSGGVQLRHQVGGGASRLGRVCPASARDLFSLRLDGVPHLKAWSSRK